MERSSKARRARRGLVAACAAVMLGVLSPTPARADFWCWLFGSGCGGGTANEQVASPQGAPEVDPGTLASALALVAGGTVVLGSALRRRRR